MVGHKRAAAVLFALVMILLGACSSGSAQSSSSSAVETGERASDDGSESPSQETGQSDEPTIAEARVSPIGDALGIAQEEFAESQEIYVRNVEEIVRRCMTDAGFDYVPTGARDEARSRLIELEGSLTAKQFTEQYGFGIATLFELNFKGQGVINFVNFQFGAAPTSARTPLEQEAFDIALNGESIQGLSAAEAQNQLFTGQRGPLPGSCNFVGFSTAENPGAAYNDLYSLLTDEFDDLEDRFWADPRVRDAISEWQVCMATAGHSYSNRSGIRDELWRRSNELGDRYLASATIRDALNQAAEESLVTMDADARLEFLERVGAMQGFAWVPEIQAEFDELIEFELAVAADSERCGDAELFESVQIELEADFVEQHGDQIALIRSNNE